MILASPFNILLPYFAFIILIVSSSGWWVAPVAETTDLPRTKSWDISVDGHI